MAGFIKRTFIHSYTQNRKVLGLVVLEEKIILRLPIVSLAELITPVSGPFLTPGAWLAGFIKRLTMHCYTQNMKALDPVVSEKNTSLCFSEDPHPPGAWPVWTQGAWLVGFIKRTFIQNMNALGLVVLEKIFYVFPLQIYGS